MNGIVGLFSAGVGVLIFIIFAFSTYFTVGQGERGVITHYGAVVGTASPGLHFKMPFVTNVTDVSVQPQVLVYGTDPNAPMEAYSQDQQPAKIQVSVNFHVSDPIALYSNYGSIDNAAANVLSPKVYAQVKNIFGKFDAVEAIQKRAAFQAQTERALYNAVADVKAPLIVDSVQIQDISFSGQYEKAVEDRMEAQVREQQALAEKTQRMTRADAAKYEVEAQADASAYATKANGDAAAGAIKARGDALRDNPDLVALTAAEKWDGVLPTTMVPGGSVPFVSLTK